MKITLVYDNEVYKKGLKADWGFSCFIEIENTPKILFDTGANGSILLFNMKKLNIDPKSIEEVFISHAHWDHTGGLSDFLEINKTAKIYVPASFSKDFGEREVTIIKDPLQIHKNIFSSIPLLGANHLEGHLYSFLLDEKFKKEDNVYEVNNLEDLFPMIALVVSGGHTIIIYMKSMTEWEKLGETRDDAVGEAFDKVARLLDLPYPGGPEIERISKEDNKELIDFYLDLSSRLTKLHVGQVWADYDREADVLYLSFRKPQRAKKTVEMGDNVLIRTDDDEVVGITILNASSRA